MQTGMDGFLVQPAANSESYESLEALARAILDEKVQPVDMVALAKDWHKKMGVCEDIHSCGCYGVRDFQHLKEVDVSKLKRLRWTQNKFHGTVRFPWSIASMLRSLNRTHGYTGCTMISI